MVERSRSRVPGIGHRIVGAAVIAMSVRHAVLAAGAVLLSLALLLVTPP